DEAEAVDTVGDEGADREERGHLLAVDGQHVALVLAAPGAQHRGQDRAVGLHDEGSDRPSDDRLGRGADPLGEPAIAGEDVTRSCQGDGTLLHLLDEHQIRLLGGLEREELGTVRAVDDERIDLTLANRPQSLLSLFQLAPELPDLLGVHRVACSVGFYQECSTRSSPSRTRALLDMSPMTRRAGNGSSFTQVGAAMICSPDAREGCSKRLPPSSSYARGKCSSQTARMLATARVERPVTPATNSRRT